MPSKLRSLVQAQKPEIKIAFQSTKKTYTTLDCIEGMVTVTAPVDIRFDDIDVEFVGTSRTYVERLTTAAAASGRSEAFHQFLKLSQPGMHHYYPENDVLKAGVSLIERKASMSWILIPLKDIDKPMHYMQLGPKLITITDHFALL